MDGELVTSSVADLLSLVIGSLREMRRVYILELPAGFLELTMSSQNTSIRELEWQLASINCESDAPAAELKSSNCRFRFAEDAFSLVREQVQVRGLRFEKLNRHVVLAKWHGGLWSITFHRLLCYSIRVGLTGWSRAVSLHVRQLEAKLLEFVNSVMVRGRAAL